jgi:YbbR domain-containing protein
MSWNLLTDEWRLKLLALGLAALMLGAVAFSQNPPTSKPLTVGLSYPNVPSNLILINPPTKINVTVSGLADALTAVTPNNVGATADASHATPGSAVKLNVTAVATDRRVGVQNPPPIVVTVDTRQVKDLPVQVIAHAAPGWSINTSKTMALCPPKTSPCTVRFDGPASWENNLTASVTIGGSIQAGTIDSPNQPVQLQNSNGLLDLSSAGGITTSPTANIDPVSVSVHVEATPGSTSSTVALVESPATHPPSGCYRVTGITVSPVLVVITGDPAVLGRIQRIMLDPVDLSGHTSDWTVQIAIKYPAGVAGDPGNPPNATVHYSISQNPNATPCP